MSNSTLAEYVNISPKSSDRSGNAVTRIIVHHMAGVSTAKDCCDYHKNCKDNVSATYYIGFDGGCAQGVDESRRPWTSGSWNADKCAVTIEVSNSKLGDAKSGKGWEVSAKSLDTLTKLCADICRRNGIKELTFTGNKERDTLSGHRQWDNTVCPGDYLYGYFGKLARDVNALLNNTEKEPASEQDSSSGSNGIWIVQAGAFSSQSAAETKAKELREAGFDAIVRLKEDLDGDGKVTAADARIGLRKAVGLENG